MHVYIINNNTFILVLTIVIYIISLYIIYIITIKIHFFVGFCLTLVIINNSNNNTN